MAKAIINDMDISGTVAVDQQFNGSSPNAQSGVAINGALTKQYSTTEFKTNEKWINGKDIYCKVVTFTQIQISANVWTTVGDLIPNVQSVIFGYGLSNEYTFPIGVMNIQALKVFSSTATGLSCVIIKYTKTS